MGSTLRVLLAQQAGRGPTVESGLPGYGKTTLAHDTMASKYPSETMVKVARTLDFSIAKPPAESETGSSWSQDSP